MIHISNDYKSVIARAVQCTEKFGATQFIPIDSVHRSGIPDFCSVQNLLINVYKQKWPPVRSEHGDTVDGEEDKSITICTLCTSQFKYTTGSTSSMSPNFNSIQFNDKNHMWGK